MPGPGIPGSSMATRVEPALYAIISSRVHIKPGFSTTVSKRSSILTRRDGRHGTGPALRAEEAWPWRQPPWEPRGRSARLRAPSPTSGAVTVESVDEAGQARCSWLGKDPPERMRFAATAIGLHEQSGFNEHRKVHGYCVIELYGLLHK